MSLIILTNRTGYELNVPRVDKSIPPRGQITVEWADSDELRYDEKINELLEDNLLEMSVPSEEKAFRPVNVYAAVANFPPVASVPEGTMAIDAANAAGWLYVAVGGNWEAV